MKVKVEEVQNDVSLDGARARIRTLAREMTRRLIGRRQEVIGLACAAISGQHVCLLGDPGTAKSMTARLFAQGLGFDVERRDGGYFEMLLTKNTKDQEILGPFSLEGIKQDRWERKLDGKLGTATIAFLDEVFKSNSVVLNSLLGLMNERVIHQESGAVRVPLRTMVGASNEAPGDNDGLSAFWDRFAIRFWVNPVSGDPKRFSELKQLSRDIESGKMPAMPACASMADFDVAAAAARAMEVPPDVDQAIFQICKELSTHSIVVSDRRHVVIDRLVRAAAVFNGNPTPKLSDLKILTSALWDTREQIKTVQDVLNKYAKDPLQDAKALVRSVLDKVAEVEHKIASLEEKDQLRLISEIDVAISTIKKNQASSSDSDEMESLLAELGAKKASLKSQVMESRLGF